MSKSKSEPNLEQALNVGKKNPFVPGAKKMSRREMFAVTNNWTNKNARSVSVNPLTGAALKVEKNEKKNLDEDGDDDDDDEIIISSPNKKTTSPSAFKGRKKSLTAANFASTQETKGGPYQF